MNYFPRVASHLGPFAAGGDRYNLKGYKSGLSPEERIRKAATIRGLDGIELNFRGLVDEKNVQGIKALLDEVGLACVNVSMNVWGESKWGLGSLSNADLTIRKDAVELIIQGMQTTRLLNCSLVSIWPGQDGFDYPFEVDYGKAVDWFVEGVRECARAVPDVRICLEYKPKEPRTHLLVDTCARTMWLVNKINCPNVGVLLDAGHGLLANENVAQSAVLLQREGLLYLIHFNDNYGDWDWDMIPGTLRFWEMLEFVFWLKEMEYQGVCSIDIMVPRADPVEAIQLGVDNIRRLFKIIETLDRETILTNLNRKNPIANMKMLGDTLFTKLYKI